MQIKHTRRLAAIFLMAGLLSPPPAPAATIAVGGTGGATEPMRLIGARYAASGADTPIDVVPGLGSGGAISAAADGVIQLAVSGRPLTAAETARGLTTAFVICTPYVLASSHPEPASLDRTAVAGIYARNAPLWPDGQPIRIVLRPKGESDNDVLFRSFPGVEEAVGKARQRDSVPVAATDQENADMAEHIPGSLVGSTYAQMITERRSLRMVAIDGVAPGIAAYENGLYPFGKHLHVIAARDPSPALTRLLAFMRSPDGLAALRESGLVPCPASR